MICGSGNVGWEGKSCCGDTESEETVKRSACVDLRRRAHVTEAELGAMASGHGCE